MMSELDIKLLKDIEQIKQIYDRYLTRDFPEDECTPWIFLKEMFQSGEYVCLGLYRNEVFLGYVFFIKLTIQGETVYLLDYFDVLECYRNEGIGAQFLKKVGVCISDADCVVAEVEDPDAAVSEEERELRQRRIHFYERNGVRVTDAKAELRGVVYRLMEVPVHKFHSVEELREIYSSLYRQMLPAKYWEKEFRLLPY